MDQMREEVERIYDPRFGSFAELLYLEYVTPTVLSKATAQDLKGLEVATGAAISIAAHYA